jgi:phosphatidylserine/phosphatidylglycerophosphate/cardiolipin synthase-like enzyme
VRGLAQRGAKAKAMANQLYLRSVHKRWLRVLAETRAQAFVCSPYLTPKLALSVIQSAPPQQCVIYTRFSIEDLASGASSLNVVEFLVKQGYPVLEIQALHAKMLLVSGEFASIGSQNITARGIRNREATFCTDDPDDVAEIERLFAPWAESATCITLEMVEDAKLLLDPLKAAFRKLQQMTAEGDASVRSAQAHREKVSRDARAAREAGLRREAVHRAEAAGERILVKGSWWPVPPVA